MEKEKTPEEVIQEKVDDAVSKVDFTLDPEELKRRGELLEYLESREDF